MDLIGAKVLNAITAPFLPGRIPVKPGPLARFLPSYPEGIAATWLRLRFPEPQNQSAPWILDPFGTSPQLAAEIARQGKRVLVAANNPIARFLLEMTAVPPSPAELQAVLADLAASQRAGERIEPHLRGLYTTHCAECSKLITAQAFLWERGATAPYARQYHCPHCGDRGERPATAYDIEQARLHSANSLQKARALERVASPDDPDRVHAEEALTVYLPRAVYALFTLINKLDGLNLPPRRRACLTAMLLSACDQANSLWPIPNPRERPLQLTTPHHYRENNIWLALEQSIGTWANLDHPVPVTIWPVLPPEEGGICIFEGRFKDLLNAIHRQGQEHLPLQAVVTILPRPNQAYWTLSALWAGWLWGREEVGPFKNVLRRRRYDWSWHFAGLSAAFNGLSSALHPNSKMLALACEAEAGMLTAALGAGQFAGLSLKGLAIRTEPAMAQIEWHNSSPERSEQEKVSSQTALPSAINQAQELLHALGQPADYLVVYTAALTGLLQSHFFSPQSSQFPEAEQGLEPTPAQAVSLATSTIRQALTFRGGFLRFNAGESPEVGQWWLRSGQDAEPPIDDRIEISIVRFLISNPDCTLEEIDRHLCMEFPGLLTPDRQIIEMCLESYAQTSSQDPSRWNLRPQETPSQRRADLERVQQQLRLLAGRLGFTCESEFPMRLVSPRGQILHSFYPIATAVLGDILLRRKPSTGQFSGQRWIIIPGGRSNLVLFKLRRNPHLRSLCSFENDPPRPVEAPESGTWKFLKFRHIQRLLGLPLLTSDNLSDLLTQDPLTYTAPQMRLF